MTKHFLQLLQQKVPVIPTMMVRLNKTVKEESRQVFQALFEEGDMEAKDKVMNVSWHFPGWLLESFCFCAGRV